MKPLESDVKTSNFYIKNTPNWVQRLKKYAEIQFP